MALLMTLGSMPAFATEPSSNDRSWAPLQVSLWPPLQVPNGNCTIYGVSMGLVVGIHTNRNVSEGEDVVGLQAGLFGAYARVLYGAQITGFYSSNSGGLVGFQGSGLINSADNIPFGVQMAGLINSTAHDLGLGLQVALVCNDCESGAGLQLAAINEADRYFTGVQIGLCNWGEGKSKWIENSHEMQNGHIQSHGHHSNSRQGVDDMRGLQLGLVNKASDMYGIQCGLLWNDAACVRGLQLGLFNSADTMAGLQIGLINIIHDNTVPFLPIVNASF